MWKFALAAVLAVSSALGQNTLIVQPGLAGAYQDLASAVAAAQDGDTIRITGAPQLMAAAPLIDKSLRILGQGAQLSGPMQISIAAGKELTMQGVSFGTLVFNSVPYFPLSLTLTNCQGRVTIADGGAFGFGQIVIQDCDQVLLARLNILGDEAPAASVTRSTVVIDHCVLHGQDGNYETAYVAREGLLAAQSTCAIVDCVVQGGNHWTTLSGTVPGTKAIGATSSALTIAGLTQVAAGSLYTGPAIGLASSQLTIEPQISTTWNGAANVQAVPSLLATGWSLGQTGTVRLRAPVGLFSIIVFGFPGDRANVPGVGDAWLDPASAHTVAIGVQTAAGLAWTKPVPNVPSFDGMHVRWQAITYDGTSFQLSPPVVAILR